MMNDQYFRLEANVMSDDRIYALLEELGMKGFGIYMALLIELRQRDNYVCAISSLKSLARKWDASEDLIKRVLQEFGLFHFKGANGICVEFSHATSFCSPYLNRVMVALERRRRTNSVNGKKGGRPSLKKEEAEHTLADEPIAELGESVNVVGVGEENESSELPEGNTKKAKCKPNQKPVEKSRVKKSKVENIDFVDRKEEKNVSAAAALKVSTAGKGAVFHVAAVADETLAPFRPWEEHVDEMEKVQTWMELMGMHSGMGRMFLDNRQRIVALFKEHVRLYAKESSITSPDAARNYFSHWIRAGSPSQRTLYARLQSELQSHSADDPYVYEQRDPLTGARSYCGLPIPPGSPPRPSPNAVWSDAIKKWSS